MAELNALAYTSVMTRQPGRPELEALLADARARNAREGVTGVLLVTPGRFFQYIEGPPLGLDTVFRRILDSSLHTDVVVHFSTTIVQRLFDAWTMGLAQVPDSALVELSAASWLPDAPERAEAQVAALAASPGMQALTQVWQRYAVH